MSDYYLILDVGTTHIKAYAFSQGRLLHVEEERLPLALPEPGWVELDPHHLMKAVYRTTDRVVEKLGRPSGVGLTNQRGSTVVWYKETGEPLFNVITWQDTRTAPLVEEYSSRGVVKLGKAIGRATFALSKAIKPLRDTRRGAYVITLAFAAFGTTHSSMHLRWIMDNVEGARIALEKGAALFGTIDSWVAWNLTGEHVIDLTNASATGIFDPFSMRWSSTIMKLVGIPPKALPRTVRNDEAVGHVKHLEAPLLAMIADQQASLYAAGVGRGSAKMTCGTGAFVDVNVGERPRAAARGVYPMVALSTARRTLYLLESFVTSAGLTFEWLRDLGLLRDFSELDEAYERGREGVVFVPALSGLGAPFMSPRARALLANLSAATTREDILRGAIDGVAAACALAIDHLSRAAEIKFDTLIVDGGLSRCDAFLRSLASFSGRTIVRTTHWNNSAYGAYMLCEAIGRGLDPVESWQPPAVSACFRPEGGCKHPREFLSVAKMLMG